MLMKGNNVVMHSCEEANRFPGKIWTCKSRQYINEQNKYVVELEGFSKPFPVEKLQLVDLSVYEQELSTLKNMIQYRSLNKKVKEVSTY